SAAGGSAAGGTAAGGSAAGGSAAGGSAAGGSAAGGSAAGGSAAGGSAAGGSAAGGSAAGGSAAGGSAAGGSAAGGSAAGGSAAGGSAAGGSAGLPPILTWTTPLIFTRNTSVNVVAAIVGDAPTTCSSMPALPTGLSIAVFNGSCRVSGTPTVAQAAATYTLTASNAFGSSSFPISLTIRPIPPALTWSPSSVTVTTGAITPIRASNSGDPVTQCDSVTLPPGLSVGVDAGTCVISGTAGSPDVSSVVVSASNAGGLSTSTLTLTVTHVPPLLTWSPNAVTVFTGVPFSLVPQNSGGPIVSCAATGLPSGVSISSVNCQLSGVIVDAFAAAPVTVTATNTGGSHQATLTLTGSNAGLIGQLGLGSQHACAVVNDTLRCWGDNSFGQLGLGAAVMNTDVPTVVPTISAPTQVVGGAAFTCAVVRGDVFCWGRNTVGQLGDGTNVDRLTPPTTRNVLLGGSRVHQLAAGNFHACALSNGSVWCWGAGTLGQLGNGVSVNSNSPVQVMGITDAQAIAAGDNYTCALVNGRVSCWGTGAFGLNGSPSMMDSNTPRAIESSPGVSVTNVTAIAAGRQHACVLRLGAVECWGNATGGRLGSSPPSGSSPHPLVVSGLTGVQAISAKSSTCAVVNGGVRCWGPGEAGQLGSGTADSVTPLVVPGAVSGAGVSVIGSGDSFHCALGAAGMSCWGSDLSGKLGNGPAATGGVVGLPLVRSDITALTASSCALANGRVFCWGDNTFFTGSFNGAPRVLLTLDDSQWLSQGVSEHLCAVRGGAATCWGKNTNGQLGRDTAGAPSISPPFPSITTLSTGVTSIATGLNHTCAIRAGSLFCWGANGNGQLGNFSLTSTITPTNVLDGVTAVDLGDNHSCAIRNGALFCWGLNANGQLGDNSTTQRTIPTQVVGMTSGVSAVAAGASHTCAVQRGALFCWGLNARGQVGDNTTQQRLVPTPVSGLITSVTKVSAGTNTTCATFADIVRCWGANDVGQLGRGTTGLDALTPGNVSNALNVAATSLSVGASHVCSLGDGLYECWGNNGAGQVGLGGTMGPVTSPAVVAGPWQ
ncbi:MAG: hypothetical protein Q8N26_33535, partial [Myxococcales bacterium]|nr:hypothetical protein [Myxococcales bacterium]